MKPGDLYINVPCTDPGYLDLIDPERKDPDTAGYMPDYLDATGGLVNFAVEEGAAAVMAGAMFETDEDIEVPIVVVPDCEDAQQRLAIAFYDNPSARMKMVGITGHLFLNALCVVMHCLHFDRPFQTMNSRSCSVI